MIKVITECLKNYLLIWGGAIGIIVLAYKKPLLTIVVFIELLMMLLSLAALI